MKKKFTFRIKPETLLIILTLLVSGFLRFYKLADNFVFGVDEEYQAYLAQTIVKDFHPVWVGVSSTADFYLGPFWTYLTSGFLYLSKGDPLITGYFAALLGVVTTLFVYVIGKKVFGFKVGLLASLLYACLPLIVFFDQKYWNVSMVPLLSLVMFFTVYSSSKNQKWWIVFSIAYGLVFHTHLSIAPFGLIALIWIVKQRKNIKLKTYLLSLMAFLVVISPLLVFDYYHKFSNFSFPIRMLKASEKTNSRFDPFYKVVAFSQSLSRLVYLSPKSDRADETNWGCTSMSNFDYVKNGVNKDYWQVLDSVSTRTHPIKTLSLVLSILLLWFLVKKSIWQKENTKLLALFIVVFFTFYIIFPGDAYEYYLLGVFPFLLFIPGIVVEKGKPLIKRLMIVVSILISILGIYTVISSKNSYGLAVKKELIAEVDRVVGNRPFELRSEGMCHIAEGWRYLFVVSGKKPAISSTDKIFGWLYQEEIIRDEPEVLVIMSEKRAPMDFDISEFDVLSIGGFSAYISPDKNSNSQ